MNGRGLRVRLERVVGLPGRAVGLVRVGVQLQRGEAVVADIVEGVEDRPEVEVALAGYPVVVLAMAAAADVLDVDAGDRARTAADALGDVLDSILLDIGHNRVRIDYTPSLADWKTAWDYVHFEGFLETEMTMQFTWDGSDSALAAPLVLDPVRLIAHADERGEGVLQPHLASFFKAPIGVDEHDLSLQLDRLSDYAERHR